jgi:hypothetical protein
MLNSSNFNYYFKALEVHGFEYSKNKKFSDEEQLKILHILEQYEEKLPRANAHQRIALKMIEGDLFKRKLLQYSRPLIVKGVPPFLIDIKEFYTNPSKA